MVPSIVLVTTFLNTTTQPTRPLDIANIHEIDSECMHKGIDCLATIIIINIKLAMSLTIIVTKNVSMCTDTHSRRRRRGGEGVIVVVVAVDG